MRRALPDLGQDVLSALEQCPHASDEVLNDHSTRLADRHQHSALQRFSIVKNAPTHDKIARRVQLEQEQFARLEHPEVRRRWCLEIDLTQVRLPPQHLEPASVCDGDDEVDAHGQSLPSGATSGITGQPS